MHDLTPVGLTKDGRKLVLISSSGEEFAVAVDSKFRAALRGQDNKFSQLEMKMESTLRPRDIQARIRAGETAEAVAAAAQTSVEAIMPFATPVLAERAHVAATALSGSIRRRGSGTSTAAGTLNETSEVYLLTHGLHGEDVEWDAWRRPDGQWHLQASYLIGGDTRVAVFGHDLRGRYVVAENTEARRLTGELKDTPSTTAAPSDSPTGIAAEPPHAVTAAAPEELPLGDDAIELIRSDDSPPLAAPSSTSSSAEAADDSLGDPFANSVSEVIAPTDPVDHRESVVRAFPTERISPPETSETATPEHVESREQAGPAGNDTPAPPAQSADTAENARAPKSKRKGRSSVPSWDEIMFGGGKSE